MGKETVLEVKGSVEDITFHLDMESGDDPVGAVIEALREHENIRYVDGFEVEEVYPIEEY